MRAPASTATLSFLLTTSDEMDSDVPMTSALAENAVVLLEGQHVEPWPPVIVTSPGCFHPGACTQIATPAATILATTATNPAVNVGSHDVMPSITASTPSIASAHAKIDPLLELVHLPKSDAPIQAQTSAIHQALPSREDGRLVELKTYIIAITSSASAVVIDEITSVSAMTESDLAPGSLVAIVYSQLDTLSVSETFEFHGKTATAGAPAVTMAETGVEIDGTSVVLGTSGMLSIGNRTVAVEVVNATAKGSAVPYTGCARGGGVGWWGLVVGFVVTAFFSL